jgi:hypothetical protein
LRRRRRQTFENVPSKGRCDGNPRGVGCRACYGQHSLDERRHSDSAPFSSLSSQYQGWRRFKTAANWPNRTAPKVGRHESLDAFPTSLLHLATRPATIHAYKPGIVTKHEPSEVSAPKRRPDPPRLVFFYWPSKEDFGGQRPEARDTPTPNSPFVPLVSLWLIPLVPNSQLAARASQLAPYWPLPPIRGNYVAKNRLSRQNSLPNPKCHPPSCPWCRCGESLLVPPTRASQLATRASAPLSRTAPPVGSHTRFCASCAPCATCAPWSRPLPKDATSADAITITFTITSRIRINTSEKL